MIVNDKEFRTNQKSVVANFKARSSAGIQLLQIRPLHSGDDVHYSRMGTAVLRYYHCVCIEELRKPQSEQLLF
jgi:hypothetical protein